MNDPSIGGVASAQVLGTPVTPATGVGLLWNWSLLLVLAGMILVGLAVVRGRVDGPALEPVVSETMVPGTEHATPARFSLKSLSNVRAWVRRGDDGDSRTDRK